MALRFQAKKLEIEIETGKSIYNADIEIEIGENEIFDTEIDVEVEIGAISMILRLPEIFEIMPTLLATLPALQS